MNCLDRIALTEYLRGKLEPEKLLAASEHIFSCPHCKQELKALQDYKPAAAYVRDAAFGITQCPDYEELSAFIDGSLADARASFIMVHASQCDLCTSDIVSLRSLRARAELAEPVIAQPVSFKRGFSLKLFPVWQKTAAAVALSALVAGMMFINKPAENDRVASNAKPGKPEVVAVGPGPVTEAGTKPDKTLPVVNPDKPAGENRVALNTNVDQPKPEAGQQNRHVDIDRQPVRIERAPAGEVVDLADLRIDQSIKARLEQALQQKLKNGSTSADKSVQMAFAAEDRLRNSAEASSDLAPKLVVPTAGVFRNSPGTLRWRPADQAANYRVTVRDEAGRTVVNQVVENTEFDLSGLLERGRNYKWTVAAGYGPGSDWKSSKAVMFRVISDDEKQAVERAEAKYAGRPEVLGTVYESFGLYNEAVGQFKKYSAAHPSELSRRMLKEARSKLASVE